MVHFRGCYLEGYTLFRRLVSNANSQLVIHFIKGQEQVHSSQQIITLFVSRIDPLTVPGC